MNLPKSDTKQFLFLFLGVLGITLLLYIIRGFGFLTFLPGGLLHILFLLSLVTGIVYGVIYTKRF